ncbi:MULTISPECIES: hypothetical protein [Providencia]|uniref:Uncharacterized protein n=1 Tax=Providencia rettgeri TaxID=587 RepID=A0AAW6UGB0_PRORE|nr:hypothetical protein [Providencia rettgeri]MDI9094330.1 hypothetical protein [Providencia rettgeri]
MKLFEKKIYIGSLLGFIATAIGLLAVFFPSLFNLEKKKIQSYSAVIVDEKDANNFYSFLDKQMNTDDIFKLDVEICVPSERLSALQSSTNEYSKYPHADSVIKFAPADMQGFLYAFSKAESNMEYIYPVYANFIKKENDDAGTVILNQLKDNDKKISEYGFNAWTGYSIPSEYIFDYYEYQIDSECFNELKKSLGRDNFGEIDIMQIKGYFTKEKELNEYRYEWKKFYIIKQISNSEINLKNS